MQSFGIQPVVRVHDFEVHTACVADTLVDPLAMATVFLVDDLDDVGVFFSIGIGNFAGVVLGAVIYKDDFGLLPGGQQRFYAAVHIGCGIITRYGKGDQLHNRPQFL